MHALGHSLQDHALLPTPLQRIDARVKLLLLLGFTLAVVTTPITAFPAFALYLALLMAGMVAAQVSPRLMLWRLALIAPFLLVAALCVPFYAGNGGLWFANLAFKSTLGAGATLLLTASTPFPRLVAALEQLGVPAVLVMIFSFTYRYFFVMAEELTRMIRARDARGYRGTWLGDVTVLGVLGQMIGTLFLRSYERGERVYLAMLSRGFQGIATPSDRPPAWARRDVAALLGIATLLTVTWGSARLLP